MTDNGTFTRPLSSDVGRTAPEAFGGYMFGQVSVGRKLSCSDKKQGRPT